MRVVLVDDQKLVRQGFRLILAVEPDITVVGEATNGAEGVDVVKETAPDVVLMDVQMPVMDGVAATAKIREFSDVKVVILTTFDRDDYLFDALDAGASGFMLKNADAESLVAGLRQVADGHALLAPEVTRRVIARSVHQGGTVTGSKADGTTESKAAKPRAHRVKKRRRIVRRPPPPVQQLDPFGQQQPTFATTTTMTRTRQ